MKSLSVELFLSSHSRKTKEIIHFFFFDQHTLHWTITFIYIVRFQKQITCDNVATDDDDNIFL